MLYTILVMPFRSQVIPTGQPTGYFVVAFGLGEPVGGWKWDLATLRAIDCGQSLHCVVADTFGLVRTPFQDLTDFTCRFAATVATSGWPLGKGGDRCAEEGTEATSVDLITLVAELPTRLRGNLLTSSAW
jgi:hypothetical protein